MSEANPTWFMARALRLAERGEGWTLPNPMVGAVLVKDNVRIGDGFHKCYGDAHAEIEAINSCKESLEGATLYVTLEPCCHQGKTPPCVETIIKSGITKVVIATLDPSPKVNGKGVEALKAAGIEVEVGLLKESARELNKQFFTFHEKKRPYITLKSALTLDGKIAESREAATAITHKRSLKAAHVLRHKHQGILVGAGTVLSDDPALTVRLVEGRNPVRIILKGERSLPRTSKIFNDENVLVIDECPMDELMEKLYEENVVSVLVEGGQTVYHSFLNAHLVDECHIFIAPLLLGEDALPFYPDNPNLSFKTHSVRQLGPDAYLTLTPQWDSNNG